MNGAVLGQLLEASAYHLLQASLVLDTILNFHCLALMLPSLSYEVKKTLSKLYDDLDFKAILAYLCEKAN